MSQENVEIVRRFVAVFNQGIDEVATDVAHSELVIHADPAWPGKLDYRGIEGAEEARAEWFENFDDIRWEIDRVIDANDRVVMLFHLRGKIKGSAAQSLEMPFGGVFKVREERVFEVRFFFSQDAALEAAGLSE